MLYALTRSIVGLGSKRLAGFYFTISSLAVLLAGAAQAQQLPIKTYTIADGLAHGSVVSISRRDPQSLVNLSTHGLRRSGEFSRS
jgi:hypothetical protein